MTPSKLVQNMRGDPKRSGNVNGLTRKYFFHEMTIEKFLIFTLYIGIKFRVTDITPYSWKDSLLSGFTHE